MTRKKKDKEKSADIPRDIASAEAVEAVKTEEEAEALEAVEKSKPAVEAAEDIIKELEEAREKIREREDKLLRLAAEFENYKKRMERERSNSLKYAGEGIIKELLPAVDNLERALEQGEDTGDVSSLLEGVRMTRDGLMGSFEKIGVKPIASVGETFDPNYHEALTMEASKEVPENVVMQEFQKGYLYKDRLIRAAKVIVSRGDAEA